MLDVAEEACQKGWHDIKIAEISHQFAFLHKEVEIAGQLYNFRQVVVRILLICCVFDPVDKRDEILVGDRELF